MSKELVERLRSKWRKPENKPPEMLEAANRIEQLEADVERLKTMPMKYRRMAFNAQLQDENNEIRAQLKEAQVEAAHWKNNHETEVRRARILKERTDMPIERVDAYEKWKEDQNLLSGFYDLTGLMQSALEEDTARIEELREQLAASQAREQQLRDALQFYSNKCHIEYLHGKRDWIADRAALEAKGFQFEWEDYNGGETFIEDGKAAEEALAIQSDTTALEAMIAKAGDVMRDRCAYSMEDYLDDPILSGHGYANGAGEEIRALPGVTLDDLKGGA